MAQLCRTVQYAYRLNIAQFKFYHELTAFNSRGRYQKLKTAVHVLKNTLSLVISRCCSADVRHEI